MGKKVWISAAGTGNAYATIRAIRENFPECFVLTSDINQANLTTASLWADVHEVSPPIDSENYVSFVKHIVDKYCIDTYIPFVDSEITLAAQLYENRVLPESIFLHIKEFETAKICENKILTYEFLKDLKISTPETSLLDNPFFAERYVLKPTKGFGSKIKFISHRDLDLSNIKGDFVLQEECVPPEVTVDVVWSSLYDRFHYICRERVETKSGVCTKARLFQDKQLGEIAFTLATRLNLKAFCFQVMQLRDEWAVIDINPRLGAGTKMCKPTGNDFFSAMLATLWGKDPTQYLTPLHEEYYITRQYEEFIMR